MINQIIGVILVAIAIIWYRNKPVFTRTRVLRDNDGNELEYYEIVDNAHDYMDKSNVQVIDVEPTFPDLMEKLESYKNKVRNIRQ